MTRSRSVMRLSTTEEWADRICAQHRKSVAAIIETGLLLIQTKSNLPHGEWGRLFSDRLVPFSQATAEQLMAIANHVVLSNSDHGQNLPTSWRTLYELTKVPEPVLREAIATGTITPDLKRATVRALLPAVASKPAAHDPAWLEDDLARAVYDALKPAHDLITQWPDAWQYRLFVHEVRQLLKRLERLETEHHEVSA